MNEAAVQLYLREHFPKENAACEWKEFKNLTHAVSGRKGEDIASYLSAIANMKGGHLIIGVEDASLRIVGIEKFHDYTPENIRQRLLGRCTNLDSEGFRVESITTSDSCKVVWIFHIPPHRPRLPVYAHDKSWQRLDDALVEMRPERLQAILSEAVDNRDWSAETVEGATVADLDEKALIVAREKFSEKYRNAPFAADIPTWDTATFLDKAKITIQGRITHTALLLLGQPQSSHFLPTLAQITWKLTGEEQAYEHFSPPFLLATTQVLHRIRNISYKLFPQNQLLATEVSKYDPRVILEALHNCIAHQDYQLRSRIIVTERVDRLIFENAGGFFEGKPEDYFSGEQTPSRYRNPWLTQAMVSLGMIDTMGFGIRTMTLSQRNRFFPLPDYSKSEPNKVVLQIYGHVIDENYTRLLLEREDLPLNTVMLLDRVQKKQPITDNAAAMLRKQGLIEGRKPNYYTAAQVAQSTGSKSDYIRNRAFNDGYYKTLILDYLKHYGSASRDELITLILDKLSDALDEKQKQNKFRNLLNAMSTRDKTIEKSGGLHKGRWVLKAPEDTEI
ncbi:ATP-dependent DNA helicase RecG [Pseudomonas helmanticensis]|jgi:ATP-dependent DNA helicase RecG|uniref:ATP-dependent DNA helicase RecG n=1 Tax=Pseudomonas helmanticensis TaxID=1471381 RepID=A0A4R7VCF9_9PSED|nr:RNA-binding domain-containing protein [Pseudomonas helmanticensis]TDV46780.1 ATP-dependent DNA helicase RecG [Pseudomonas helmanticensis]